MVHAFLYFDTTDGAGFAQALTSAAPALVAGKGYLGHQLLRGVEHTLIGGQEAHPWPQEQQHGLLKLLRQIHRVFLAGE